MKEKIETKLEEIINIILEKEKEKITYEEFSILMLYLYPLKAEEQKKKNDIEFNKIFEKLANVGGGENV